MDTQPDYAALRRRMVREQLIPRGINDEAVLGAMERVERHRFMPATELAHAYEDGAFPLPNGQTISQPYIVALMTQMLQLEPGQRVLEIGTGSGYQTAVLAELGADLHTLEQDELLARDSARLLRELGYDKVSIRHGNGWAGWPEQGPYERILVTCAPPQLPEKLVAQLAPGGRMVLPMGPAGEVQHLFTLSKDAEGTLTQKLGIAVRFVPMLK